MYKSNNYSHGFRYSKPKYAMSAYTMVEVEGAKRAFQMFYEKLIEALPINDLLSGLYASKLLRGNAKAKVKTKVESLSTQKEKAKYLLNEVIKPGLSVGNVEQFNKMITVMESSDDPVVKHLAKQIQECALGVSPNSSDPMVCSVCQTVSVCVYARERVRVCAHAPVGATIPYARKFDVKNHLTNQFNSSNFY